MDTAGLAACLRAFLQRRYRCKWPTCRMLTLAGTAVSAAAVVRRLLERQVSDDWRVTSYSGLQQNMVRARLRICRVLILMPPASVTSAEPQLTPASVSARRIAMGRTFLHSLFEDL